MNFGTDHVNLKPGKIIIEIFSLMVNRKDLFSWKITAIPNGDIQVVFCLFRPKHQLLSSAFTMLLFERPDIGHSTI